MKVFFRKHGNTAFYILLPVFFLVLTVAFIQFTPRLSHTTPGAGCEDANKDCCTDSGCGAETSEVCVDSECKGINFGCPDGGETNFSPDGTCTCIDKDDKDFGECFACPIGDAFVAGVCSRICLEGEDPIVNKCAAIDGGSNVGGCSLGGASSGAPSMVLFGFAAANLAWMSFRARRKK